MRTRGATLLRARAIENQCYVVGVNRVGKDGNGATYAGDSVAVDFLGPAARRARAAATASRPPCSISSRCAPIATSFPAQLDADRFELVP